MPLENLDDLQASWLIFLEDRNAKGKYTQGGAWRRDNPAEWEKLQAYRAGTGPRPDLVTQLGRQMVEETDAWLEAKGTVEPPPEPKPVPAGVLLPTYRLHIKPNHYWASDGAASGYRAIWIDHDSPTTNDTAHAQRVIASPQAVAAGVTLKSWVWWFALEVMIDPSWDSTQQGDWGTLNPNCHNASDDVGNTGRGGIGWGFGAGTSAIQHDYIGGSLYQHIQNDSAKFSGSKNLIQADLPKGVWHSILMELTLGRRDGSIPPAGHPNGGAGRIRTWLNGADTPVDTGDTNTLQKATNPDNGLSYIQTIMTCWSGFYTKNADTMELILSTTAARIGRTLAECLADVPVKTGARVSDIYDGSGLNLGPSFYEILGGADQRSTAMFKLPASL